MYGGEGRLGLNKEGQPSSAQMHSPHEAKVKIAPAAGDSPSAATVLVDSSEREGSSWAGRSYESSYDPGHAPRESIIEKCGLPYQIYEARKSEHSMSDTIVTL